MLDARTLAAAKASTITGLRVNMRMIQSVSQHCEQLHLGTVGLEALANDEAHCHIECPVAQGRDAGHIGGHVGQRQLLVDKCEQRRLGCNGDGSHAAELQHRRGKSSPCRAQPTRTQGFECSGWQHDMPGTPHSAPLLLTSVLQCTSVGETVAGGPVQGRMDRRRTLNTPCVKDWVYCVMEGGRRSRNARPPSGIRVPCGMTATCKPALHVGQHTADRSCRC